MRPWQFSRPKGPGFGISRNFYLSVLLSRSVLPSILQVINPKGEGGAAEGFGAPLASGADKDTLQRPLVRGAYAVASKDRKTVLRMLVMSPSEAGYDPEAFARSSMGQSASPELLSIVRGAWNLAQFGFESHDPDVYPSLDFIHGVAIRLALLGDGVIADPIARRYLLPGEVFVRDRMAPQFDVREHVTVQFLLKPNGLYAYTTGMVKFALPEYEMAGIDPADEGLAHQFLWALGQKVLLGDLTKNGDLFGAPKMAFEAQTGGLDRAMWEGIPVFELIPPTGATASACLKAWKAVSSR